MIRSICTYTEVSNDWRNYGTGDVNEGKAKFVTNHFVQHAAQSSPS